MVEQAEPRSGHEADGPTGGAPVSFVWRFGQAEFDEARWRLTVAGQVVDLEPRPLEVLRQLLRYAGEVVRKDELMEAVYGHLHVSDGALNQAVSKLRTALGDREQQIIATVHRLGYRLAVPVVAELAAGAQPAPVRLEAGGSLPGREGWELVRVLSSNRQIEVWLARHRKLGEQRVFKISIDGVRLSSLKREVTLYRMLREQLGDRDDFVRLLDWNFETAPFFIESEYAGTDLVSWWKQQNGAAGVPLQTRLELLSEVADAVAAAHSVGVLHKDLKPGNILIYAGADGRPRARVADFGSGNLLQQESLLKLGITRLGFTQTQSAPNDSDGGTPLYLAPEVISGGGATALSDVYALGIVLYQLVVGQLRKPLAAGWERDVADEVLRGDIAAAIDGSPLRRLPSARELADRLRTLEQRRNELRHQRALVERAERSARQLERIRARRPWRITAGLSVLLGLAVSGWFYVDALRASRQAREQAQLAVSVTDFFTHEVLAAAAPYQRLDASAPATVRQAVDRAAAQIGNRFADQPATEAAIRAALGQVYGQLTNLPAAIEQDRRALALFQQSLGPDHPRSLQAQYWLAQDLSEASEFDEALRLLDAADALRTGAEDRPTDFAAHRARCYHGIITSRYAEALPDCQATLNLQRELAPRDNAALFKWQANLATLYSRMGQFDKANPLFVEGLETLRRDGGAESQIAARFANLYGINLVLQRRYPQAEAVLKTAYQAMAKQDSNNLYAHETLGYLASVYLRTGRPALAVEAAQASYDGYRHSAGESSHYTAQAQALLGTAEIADGRPQPGLRHLRSAHRSLMSLLGEQHPQTQSARFYLARALIDLDAASSEAGRLLETLDAARLETASAEGDWEPRVQLLKARQLAANGQADHARRLASAALTKLRALATESQELAAGEALLASGQARP